jgi:hypothetical protein
VTDVALDPAIKRRWVGILFTFFVTATNAALKRTRATHSVTALRAVLRVELLCLTSLCKLMGVVIHFNVRSKAFGEDVCYLINGWKVTCVHILVDNFLMNEVVIHFNLLSTSMIDWIKG